MRTEQFKKEWLRASPERYGEFWFGNVRSSDFGVYFSNVRIGNSPERDITFQTIPGRNGDLTQDNQRWNNLEIVYSLVIPRSFSERFDDFKRALLLQMGYQRLTDTIYPEVFRLAILRHSIEPEVMRRNQAGRFDLTFSCKPQRFLKSGDQPLSVNAPTIINNDGFPALPIIKVYGTGDGTVTVGGITVKLKGLSGDIILDCEMQNAYREAGSVLENMNTHIYAPEFPALVPGPNKISWSGGVERLEITPRWWTI